MRGFVWGCDCVWLWRIHTRACVVVPAQCIKVSFSLPSYYTHSPTSVILVLFFITLAHTSILPPRPLVSEIYSAKITVELVNNTQVFKGTGTLPQIR
jgi:hypothetical protein